MKQKRKFRFKVSSILTSALILFTCTNYTIYAQPTYSKAYTLENILSDYEYFVQEDLIATNSGHCVSAIAVGGTLDTPNTIGDAQIAATYVKHVKSLSNFEQGKWLDNSPYAAYKVTDFYYDTLDPSIPSWLAERLTHAPGYIDFDTAFPELANESATWAESGTPAYSIDNGKLIITLAPATDTYVTIPYNDITTASSITIEGLSSVQDFVDYRYIISITGVDSTDYILSFYNINMNGKAFNNILKDNLQGGTNGAQINLEGMKLVWNFPDATSNLTVQGLSGHLVAPQADVSLEGGNFEGGVIARNVKKSDAEGHFYPFNKPGVPSPDPSPTPTTSPDPSPTPTTSPDPSPTPTTSPDPSPTPTTSPDPNPTPTTDANNSSSGNSSSDLPDTNTTINNQTDSNTQDNASPKTGENHSTTVFLVIILISGVGLISIKKQSKKIH